MICCPSDLDLELSALYRAAELRVRSGQIGTHPNHMDFGWRPVILPDGEPSIRKSVTKGSA